MILLRDLPSPDSTDAQIAAWFADGGNTTPLLLGVHLSAFAVMTFLWFVAAIRSRMGDLADPLLVMLFVASGVLVAASAVVATAGMGAVAAAVNYLDWPGAATSETVGTSRGLAYVAVLMFGCRMAAMFVLATSSIALHTGALPRPLVYAGFAIGLVLFVGPGWLEITVALFPIWVFVLGIEILRSGTRLPQPSE